MKQVVAVVVGILAAIAVVGLLSSGGSPEVLLQQPAHQARVMHAVHKAGKYGKLLPVAQAFPIHLASAPQAKSAASRGAAQRGVQKSASTAKYGTEKQALAAAKVWARQEYAATIKAAQQSEAKAEAQEQKRRAAMAAHDRRRAQRMAVSKSAKDAKEGWGKLNNEMGLIMDGYDGLHYKGATH